MSPRDFISFLLLPCGTGRNTALMLEHAAALGPGSSIL
jgi:hypothetical protein